jgi:Family of unknown function (DUF5906)
MKKSIPKPTAESSASAKVALDDLIAGLCRTGKSYKEIANAIEALPFEEIELIPHIDRLVHEINQRYCIVSLEGQTVILEETVNAEGHTEVMFLKLNDLNLRMRNRYVIDRNGKQSQASQAWLAHPLRREYTRMVFEPSGAAASEYNLYQGLGITPKAGDCTMLRGHIFEHICIGDTKIFDYLEAWVADILKNPSHLPGVAVVLRGAEGVGKGIFGQALLKLFAPHTVHITQAMQVMGRFNGILKGILFAFLDEAFWAGDKQYEGVLKGLITESKIIVEHKGKEPFELSSYARFLMASNSDWVIPAGIGARRFLVLDVSDKRKADFAYFKALTDHINGGGLEAWAHHLVNLDCSGIELRDAPKTKALFDQKLESLNSMQRYIYEILMDGNNCHADSEGDWKLEISKANLYRSYLDKAAEIGEKRRSDTIKFSNTVKKMLGIREDRTTIQGKRERVWCFPSLDICRQRFDQYMDASIDWPEIKASQVSKMVKPSKF